MQNDREEKLQNGLEKIKNFCLLDDDFMTACFQDNIEGTELVIQIIMDNKDLCVTDVKTQYTVKNIHGRSVRLDVYATDKVGKKYNIEIQRASKGAGVKRARFNSALIDSREIPAGMEADELPETYVIFITEQDVLGEGLPIYHIDRYIEETGEKFGDGAHIIYVNAQTKDETPLGRLMSDFACKNSEDMYYPELAKRVKYLKNNEKGVQMMSGIMEEIVYEEKIEIVENFLELGGVAVEKIAKATGIPLEKVIEIQKEMANAS